MMKKGKILRKLERILRLDSSLDIDGWIAMEVAKQDKHWETLTPMESYNTFWDNHTGFLRAMIKETKIVFD